MPVLQSNYNLSSEHSAKNLAKWKKIISKLNKTFEDSRFEGNDKQILRAKKGKFLAREDELILDRDSPFLELMPFSGLNYTKGFGTGGTNVCGIGLVENKICVINSNIGTKRRYSRLSYLKENPKN